jgi:hypothetical protein
MPANTTIIRLILGLALLLSASDGVACAVVELGTPREFFRDDLQRASTIAIFRLESLQLLERKRGEFMEGRIRVVDTLKGSAARFTRISIAKTCSWTQLAVGGYFLVATTQSGRTLNVDISDYSVLDVTLNYIEGDRDWSRNPDNLGPIFDFIDGKPLPSGFPTLDMLARSKAPMWRKHHEKDP